MTKEKIGLDACIDALGREFVMTYKDNSCFGHGEDEQGHYCFLGISTKPHEQKPGPLTLDAPDCSPIDSWDYYATCHVKDSGDVIMGMCKLPSIV